jgi:hypothetical protein
VKGSGLGSIRGKCYPGIYMERMRKTIKIMSEKISYYNPDLHI